VALTANDANQNKCKCAFMRFKLACGQRAGIASCNLHISVSSHFYKQTQHTMLP